MNSFSLPTGGGAYRWLYLDVTSGEQTVVAIFMLGSIFSPRYSAKPDADPMQHCAVNFAVYERGARTTWVLSEYVGASLSSNELRIGESTWRWADDGAVRVDVKDRTAPWGRPVEALIELTPACAKGEEIELAPGHYWRPMTPRANATVQFQGSTFRGFGYHDGNHGVRALGSDLPRWKWTRVHGPRMTDIVYEPHGTAPIHVRSDWTQHTVTRPSLVSAEVPTFRSGWGLKLPAVLAPWSAVGAPRKLESSPFYARLEATGPDLHALTEVADFERFHRPTIRWMARFRERVERAAR